MISAQYNKRKISLIFPHQLFADTSLWQDECYLIEETLFFTLYPFHKQKLVLHRASMKAYEQTLIEAGKKVHYIDSASSYSDCRQLIASFEIKHVDDPAHIHLIHYVDVVDDWLRLRLQQALLAKDIRFCPSATPMFLNPISVYWQFFAPIMGADGKPMEKRFFHHEFYLQARKREKILLEADNKPTGGKWSFDTENRKKYPRKKKPPTVTLPPITAHYQEAVHYVNTHFCHHYGEASLPQPKNQQANVNTPLRIPITHQQSLDWLDEFLRTRFAEFGVYEDAIVDDEHILNHSLLTPMLNIGLLTPKQVIERTLEVAIEYDIPLNSLEGFIRQIIGWREFMYGLYESVGRQQRTRNFWGFTRKIPRSFYTGDTGILPIDTTIKKLLKTGYCHHIERLMVLGNFMLLCEFDPDEVYRWFMEMFIDAYDWVMVPNIYGMSQFADGGLMATKPYISGSNYLSKMSNYQVKSKGVPVEWAKIWDGLFWRFMHTQRKFFSQNPRIGMLLNMWDKMDEQKQQAHLTHAQQFLAKLDAD